jgi:RHS repeat-associated protein
LYLQQDSLHNVIEHNSWVYYALGGKKEQLAVYHGQEVAVPGCLPPGPVSVYFYPVEFLTYGNGSSANLVTIPDVGNPAGVKEFHIADHLGSTRVTINTSTGSQYADYGPDGNLLAGGASVREGYIGKELGRENGLLNCGVRDRFWAIYNRDDFNRPDALWEQYRSVSPYVYAQNNPMRFIDVTGLSLEDVERIVSAIDGTLNDAWQASNPSTGANLEHGATIVEECGRLYGDPLIYASNFVVGSPVGIAHEYNVAPDEEILGTFHTHAYVQPDGLEMGAAPSDADIESLGKGIMRGKYEIIEAGNKRFAIEVVDVEKAKKFVKEHDVTDILYKKIDRVSGTTIERIMKAAKYVIVDYDSGMKFYQSVDASKLKFEEVK